MLSGSEVLLLSLLGAQLLPEQRAVSLDLTMPVPSPDSFQNWFIQEPCLLRSWI